MGAVFVFGAEKAIMARSFVAALALLGACASADVQSFNRVSARAECPTVETMPDFDPMLYTGRWYQQAELGNHLPGEEKCVYADYGDGAEQGHAEGTLSVYNNQVRTADDSYAEICGWAECPDPEFPAKCLVHFIVAPFPGDLWILDTDYETFGAAYSCRKRLLGGVEESGFVLTRQPEYDPFVVARAFEVFSANGIDISAFDTTVQDDGTGNICQYESPY